MTSVAANPRTGNVLVHFDPHRDHAAIARRLEAFMHHFPRPDGKTPSTAMSARRPPQPANPTDSVETGDTPWHCSDGESVLRVLRTSVSTGLTEQDAATRLQQDGPNALSAAPPRSRFGMFVEQFTSLPVLLLGAAGGLSLVTGGLIDAVVIVSVVGLNAVITVCLDKTGTLTYNRMSVVAVHVGMTPMHVDDGQFSAQEALVEAWDHAELARLLQIVVLCSETEVETQAGGYSLRGSSTENALVHMALCADLDVGHLRQCTPTP